VCELLFEYSYKCRVLHRLWEYSNQKLNHPRENNSRLRSKRERFQTLAGDRTISSQFMERQKFKCSCPKT
jgi:hypothetical protein